MTDYLPPLAMMLVRWTLLLALAWGVQFVLRRKHARGRQILWRGVLISGAAVALLPLVTLPHVVIPIGSRTETRDKAVPVAAEPVIAPSTAPAVVSAGTPAPVAAVSSATPIPTPQAARLSYPLTLAQTLVLIWAAGAAVGIIRLMVHYRRLRGLRAGSVPADAALASDLDAVRVSLNVRQPVDLRISRRNSSPFLCGMRQPLILVPAALTAGLSAEQRAALLAHEVAHVRRHDIFWCTAFRGATALLWFHPLAWKIAAAHELACEQEADRLAVGHEENRGDYARVLAELALRVLTIAPRERHLALSVSSQIAGRVEYLKRPVSTTWKRRHTFMAACMTAGLFLFAAGCEFTMRQPIDVNAPIEFRKVVVVVKDEAGQPIEGAEITPRSFRVKGVHAADAYPWNEKRFGPPVPARTDAAGKAWVQYPVMGIPEEQELTGAILFNIARTGFCTVLVQDFFVDKPNDALVMKRSGELDVSAVFGAQRVPVTDIVVNLSGGREGDWEKGPGGQMVNAKVEPGDHVLQLMGKRDSGEIVFSAARVVHVDREKTTREVVEMAPAIRVEGCIDASVPRPITNGLVFIGVRPPQFPVNAIVADYYAAAGKYGSMTFWHTWRPINADGTFVFEAVPPGEADMAAVGDGFVSQSEGEFRNRMPDGSIENKPDTRDIEPALRATVDELRLDVGNQFYSTGYAPLRKLHHDYIFHVLDELGDMPNVIFTVAFQYAGPLAFEQFFQDTVAEWERQHNRPIRIALIASKQITDAILEDPVRSKQIAAVDMRYWQYRPDGSLWAPIAGENHSYRELIMVEFKGNWTNSPPPTTAEQVYRQVREYRDRYPNVALLPMESGAGPIPILMAGAASQSSIHIPPAAPPTVPTNNPPTDRRGVSQDAAIDKFVHDFLAGDLMKMGPRDGFAEDPTQNWALADDASTTILIYSRGGPGITLARHLPGTAYETLWFDPNTGTTRDTPSAPVGTAIQKPDSHDWLLLLRARN